MNTNNYDKDILFGDDLLVRTPIAKLNDDNKFELNNDDEIISDSEFNDLLSKLGISKKEEEKTVKVDKDKDKEHFDLEKEFAMEKIKIEYDLLQIARMKFEREKKSWETLMKISEQNFKAEKEEFEAYKEREMKRIYLESQKLVYGCKDFKELFEKYKSQ